MTHVQARIEVVLAEYASVRSEILQLNSQLFAVLTSTLALNIGILGWLFDKEQPSNFFALPTLGILVLLSGTAILLNRNRLSHRLGYFQKYFLEPRLLDLCWASVYFKYRESYPESRWNHFTERLAESGAKILWYGGLLNLAILLIIALLPLTQSAMTTIDWFQVGNFVVALALISLQMKLISVFTDYSLIESTFGKMADGCGLTRRSS